VVSAFIPGFGGPAGLVGPPPPPPPPPPKPLHACNPAVAAEQHASIWSCSQCAHKVCSDGPCCASYRLISCLVMQDQQLGYLCAN
jgi:hypothetical protein